MSCTTCGSNKNCHCSDNCPNKASDITTFDCTSLSAITVPCGASLCDVLGLLELYITNTASEVSVINDNLNITKHDLLTGPYGVDQVLSQAPAMGILWADQDFQTISIVHDDDDAYLQGTGLWTCPTDGRYDVSFSIRMVRPINPITGTGDGWYDSGSPGLMQAAIVGPDSEDVVVGGTYASVVIQESIYISGAIGGFEVTAGQQLGIKIINTTGSDFLGEGIIGPSFVRMAIRKV